MYIFAIARRTVRSLTLDSEGTRTVAESGAGQYTSTSTSMDNDGYQPSNEAGRPDPEHEQSKKGEEPQGSDDVDLSISAHPGKTKYDVEAANQKKPTGEGTQGVAVPTHWFVFMIVILAVGFCLALGLGIALGHPDPSLAPYQFTRGAVASDNRLCSEVGRDLLKNGGNALDAAIATTLCLGVLNLHVGGVGGGGFLVMYNRTSAGQKNVVITAAIDAQVIAPSIANSDMFEGSGQDANSKGGMAIAIPGEVAGLYKAHSTLGGALPWATLLEPSIRLAKGGFAIGEALAGAIAANEQDIKNETFLSEILVKTNGDLKQRGDRIQLPKLAATLETIATLGADGFYKGDLAKKIVEDVNEAGGNITLVDLKNYTAHTNDTVSVELGGGQLYGVGGIKVYAPPPPSCGILTNYILNILEGYDLNWRSTGNTEDQVSTYHRMLESFKFAFAERGVFGDPKFVKEIIQDIERLGSSSTARTTREKIQDSALSFADYGSMHALQADVAGGATHVSVKDNYGNAVSYTSSISLNFGAKKRGNRTGIMFNAGMGDFSLPNSPQVEGLAPSPMNFIQPGKRPLSSMSPLVLVDSDDDVKAVIGASGGSDMITSTAMMAVQTIWFEDNVIDAMDRARIHSELEVQNGMVTYDREDGVQSAVVTGLSSRDHVERHTSSLTSSVNLIMQTKKNRWYTNADERVPGSGYAHY